MKECVNLDLQNVCTPVNVDQLRRWLTLSNYDREKTKFLVDGFVNGFDLGYAGPKKRRNFAKNIPFTVGDKFDLWDKIMKEVKLKHFAGLFEEPPFEYFIQSPVRLVQKANGKTRLIFHLSYDFDENNKLVNHHIPDEICTVKYKDLDFAVRESL